MEKRTAIEQRAGNRVSEATRPPLLLQPIIEDCMVCASPPHSGATDGGKSRPFSPKTQLCRWTTITGYGLPRQVERSISTRKIGVFTALSGKQDIVARPNIYQESIQICRRHTGSVHRSYYQGYWHHRIYEEDNRASRLLRRYHVSYTMLAWFHHKWNHRDRYG